MKLVDLEACFIKLSPEGHYRNVPMAEAQGVMYQCPKCFQANGGPVGTHYILNWFNNCGVPADKTPGPGRWNPQGSGLHDLTYIGPGATSVLLESGCGGHWQVESGEIKMC